MEKIEFAKPKIHLFVCVNDRTCIAGKDGPSCSPTITASDVNSLKVWVRDQGLASVVYCTKAKCLGFCNPQGGVACVYPSGNFYKGIRSVDELKRIVGEELVNYLNN